MSLKKIGFLLSENYEQLIAKEKSFREEFEILAPHFRSKGFELEKLIWSREFNSKEYVALIPKSVWDYTERPAQFAEFMDHMDGARLPMINSSAVVRWNMNKRYLAEVQSKGFPTLALKLYPQGRAIDLKKEKPFTGKEKLLIKPSISAGAKNTVIFPASQLADQQPLAELILKESDLIIQPFYEEVAQGEYSFFFFGGQLSHAILKVPAKGDFRAHSYYQATNSSYHASEIEISEAKKFISAAPGPVAYARVDLIKVDGVFHLVELELIEPYLYFEVSGDLEHSARMFAEAVISSIE